MPINVIGWLRAQTRFVLDESTFEIIAEERGVVDNTTPHTDLTLKQKQLMLADIIFTALMFSPSNTASYSNAHGDFKESWGSESTTYVRDKIRWALGIYKLYDDPKANMTIEQEEEIKTVEFEDKI